MVRPLALLCLLTLAGCGGGTEADANLNEQQRLKQQLEKDQAALQQQAENHTSAIEQAMENETAIIFENRENLLNEAANQAAINAAEANSSR